MKGPATQQERVARARPRAIAALEHLNDPACAPHITDERRLTTDVLAIAVVGGVTCWAIIGTIRGAVGLWSMLTVVLLVFCVAARAVGAGGE